MLNGNYTGAWFAWTAPCTGTVVFNRTAGTVAASVSNDATLITLTGSATFAVQSDNQITIGVVTLTGGGSTYQIGRAHV